MIKIPNPGEKASKTMCLPKVLIATYKTTEKCLTKSKLVYKLSKDHGYNCIFSWDNETLNQAVPDLCKKTFFCTNSMLKLPEDPRFLSPTQGDWLKVGEKIKVEWEKTKHAKDDDFQIYLCKQIDGMSGIKMSLLGTVKGDKTSFETTISRDTIQAFYKSNLYGTCTDHLFFISIIVRCKDCKKCKGASTFIRGINTFSVVDMSEPMVDWPPEP